MGNPVVQFQILTRTPEETAKFYSNLFGWTVNADNPLGYREISTGAREGIQGGIWPAPPQSPNFVQLFIAVDNVQMFSERAEKAGGKVIIPPTVCRMAVKWRCFTIRKGCRSEFADEPAEPSFASTAMEQGQRARGGRGYSGRSR